MKLLTCDDEEQPRSWAPLIRRLTRVYLYVSLPIVAIFVLSPGTRFAAAQALARGFEFVVPISRVFCGDAVTRDAGVWGWRINAMPFGTLTLADGNVTSWQIVDQVRAALKHQPKTIYLTAGRYDVESPDYDEDKTILTLKSIVQMANDHGAHVALTLAPYGVSPEKNAALAALNERIEKDLSDDATILNLNNTIAPQGTLLQQYTNDGSTLNEAAYGAWAGLVKATMAGGDAFRPAGSR